MTRHLRDARPFHLVWVRRPAGSRLADARHLRLILPMPVRVDDIPAVSLRIDRCYVGIGRHVTPHRQCVLR